MGLLSENAVAMQAVAELLMDFACLLQADVPEVLLPHQALDTIETVTTPAASKHVLCIPCRLDK